MKTAVKFLSLGLLTAFICNGDTVLSAVKIVHSTNSADAVACQRQLNTIHSALQEYQRQNGRLPVWLSDLVPDFIQEREILVCPYVRNSGILREWRKWTVNVPVFGDPGDCSYGYEFSTQRFWRDLDWTTRTYKQHQMELIGFDVPIVRCLAHLPALNLGYGGSIYSSPGEWEDNFVRLPEHRTLLHNFLLLTNIPQNQLAAGLSPLRKTGTDARLLDLSMQYNASLLHLSQIQSSGKLLVSYPEGEQKIDGINFDVRGLVHLTARQFPIPFPERVADIPVNRKCASIQFLHGATSVATNGSKVASLVLHLADGRKSELPIIYGKDVRSRWFDRKDQSEPQSPKPAWITPPDKIGPTGKSLRLYVSSWKNETPNTDVTSIDFVSDMSESAPFLLAITVE